MRFRLTVTQGRGVPRQLDLAASDRNAAIVQAENLGFSVLICERAHTVWPTWPMVAVRSNEANHAVLVEQLRDLLNAGLSIVEALDVIARSATTSTYVAALRNRLLEGKQLSAALEADGNFPPLLIALVRAAEHTSQLSPALDRYLEHHKVASELKHRLHSAAIYPTLLLIVGSLVLAFLVFVVMPRFAVVYEGMTTELPGAAQAMVTWANWIKATGTWWLLPALIALALLAALALSQPVRAKLVQSAMRVAAVRELAAAHFLARWYRATGMLLQGGITLPISLGLTNMLLPGYLQPAGLQVKADVESGLSPSQAYAKSGMATPVAEQLMSAGDRSGDLGGVLTRIAQFHESEVARKVERFMRTLEPLVMVLIGIGVGLVVVLMYMPIFELASAVQ
jgi:general secretion pathway protein F